MKRLKSKAVAFTKKKNHAVLEKRKFLEAIAQPVLNEELKVKVLHAACSYDRLDVAEKLSNNQANIINEVDETGKSAIFYAVEGGSTDCFNFLLSSEVELNHVDNSGSSVLVYGISLNNFNIVDKLIRTGKFSTEVLKHAIRYIIDAKKSEALAILADYDVIDLKEFAGEVNFTDKKQYSPLHYAAKRGFAKAVSKLLYAGSKLTFRNTKDTPIGLALAHAQYDVACILLRFGSIPEIDEKSLSWQWMVLVKTDESSACKSITGDDFQHLLKYLKLINTHANRERDIHIFCRNYHSQLELLDPFCSNQVLGLMLFNCTIKHIPKFESLECLCLNSCTVDSYENIGCLQHLKILNICNNDLLQLPEAVKELKQLEYLEVSYNKKLTKLPEWIIQLSRLRVLAIQENNITELPDLLPNMLEVLFIENNCIQKLSPLLARLECLSYISLRGNLLLFPEVSIAKSKTKVLLQYLHAFLSDTVPNNTVKVSLVGKETAGKTTLTASLKSQNGICENTSSIKKTDGLDILDLSIGDIRLRMFDLAGDIDYIETHSMFISEGTLFLAVFDVRTYSFATSYTNVLARLETWLTSIFSQAPNSRVIIVGTHCDAEMISESFLDNVWKQVQSTLQMAAEKHVADFGNAPLHSCLLCNNLENVSRQSTNGIAGYVVATPSRTNSVCELDGNGNLGLSFPHVLGYYEVSNVNQVPKQLFSNLNLSIDQLRKGVRNACADMLTLRPSIPRKWFNLQQVLLKHVEDQYPIIRYQRFAELAAKCGFENDDEEPFLRHFHSCGEILYYFEIEELCDVIILDPQWLSNQLRTVVSYRNIEVLNDGTIKHAELEHLWSHLELEYRDKLLSLFRQAGIFIPFNDDSDLIPCRLPVGRPSDDVWPRCPDEKENQVDYYFQFDNLPPSFFSFLIALVEKQRCNFTGKMPPVYYSNHIVYITKSNGIPCEVHTIKDDSVNNTQCRRPESITNGLSFLRFLSVEPGSIDNLLDSGRNSTKIQVGTEYNNNSLSIDYKHEKRTRHRVHFELLPHLKAITLSIRGPRPCCLAPQTIDMLNRIILTRYEGIRMKFYILCSMCIRKSLNNPSKFTLDDMERNEPICEKGHDLVNWNAVLIGKCDYTNELTTEKIMRSLTDNDCPKLFVMVPVNLHSLGLKEFYTLTYLKEGYSVHLLCEYPNCWHFLSAPGYRLNRPKDFFKKYGRRLRTVLRVLASLETPTRLASSVFEPLCNFADCLASLRKLSDDLNVHLTDFQDDWSFKNVSEDLQYLKGSEGLQRRELRRFLNKADEENRFGDLIPTFVGKDLLWVCEEHYKLEKVH
ncbi:uncharacterized protein LOC130656792 [Hydractinia symbiolongicarpus]|uniref:uncharacterized protein LOC130656792 n=1 Tax=Hydractinia symbiolongicarpus TaxID=13093 RepID=UPI00254E3DB4|nr:uncharacterized protein LOC130656792 [Hydractinia symbiolongicarpus]